MSKFQKAFSIQPNLHFMTYSTTTIQNFCSVIQSEIKVYGLYPVHHQGTMKMTQTKSKNAR